MSFLKQLNRGVFYISEDLNSVVMNLNQEFAEPLVYCLPSTVLAGPWNEVGAGSEGLEELIVRLDSHNARLNRPKRPVKARQPGKDPREIVF